MFLNKVSIFLLNRYSIWFAIIHGFHTLEIFLWSIYKVW